MRRHKSLQESVMDLQRRNEALLELNRTKDEFITIASHQLRTPATAIKQYLGLLLGGYSDPLTDDQRNFLQRAYESNERQLNIVNDILRIAQLDADKLRLNFKSNDLRDIVRKSAEQLLPEVAKREQTLEIKLPETKVPVVVDEGQLMMVIENLIENASHYSKKGKKIDVNLKKSKINAILAVTDEGVGIKKTDMGKLFQKFSRIPNPLSVEAGGSGLGLYWAEKIIKLHDGKIKVNSTAGKGTTFSVYLPLKKK